MLRDFGSKLWTLSGVIGMTHPNLLPLVAYAHALLENEANHCFTLVSIVSSVCSIIVDARLRNKYTVNAATDNDPFDHERSVKAVCEWATSLFVVSKEKWTKFSVFCWFIYQGQLHETIAFWKQLEPTVVCGICKELFKSSDLSHFVQYVNCAGAQSVHA